MNDYRCSAGKKLVEHAEDIGERIPGLIHPGDHHRLEAAVGRLAVSSRRARQEPGIVTYSGTARQIRRSRWRAKSNYADHHSRPA